LLRPARSRSGQAGRLHRALGDDGPDSSPGNTLGAQKLVHGNRLTRKLARGKVLGDRGPHRRAPNGLPLSLGDPVPATRQLVSESASALARSGAVVKVFDRQRPRLRATLCGRTSHHIGVHIHPNLSLLAVDFRSIHSLGRDAVSPPLSVNRWTRYHHHLKNALCLLVFQRPRMCRCRLAQADGRLPTAPATGRFRPIPVTDPRAKECTDIFATAAEGCVRVEILLGED
jgi:hypothetical protein